MLGRKGAGCLLCFVSEWNPRDSSSAGGSLFPLSVSSHDEGDELNLSAAEAPGAELAAPSGVQ